MSISVNVIQLQKGISWGVINANVTPFYGRSELVQITLEGDTLTANIQSDRIRSELSIKGEGNTELKSITVSSVLFKNLILSLDSTQALFDVDSSGESISITSGKSTLTLPKLDDAGLTLDRPETTLSGESAKFNVEDWKFIKSHQSFALSQSLAAPLFTRVLITEDGDVITGDFADSRFTLSQGVQLKKRCLMFSTVINFLSSLPEDTEMFVNGDDLLIKIAYENLTFISSITPNYEGDAGMGEYPSEAVIGLFETDEASTLEVDGSGITRLLRQSKLLASASDTDITMDVSENGIKIYDRNVKGDIDILNKDKISINSYTLNFNTDKLMTTLSNIPGNNLKIKPTYNDGDLTGIVIYGDELSVVISALE